LILRLRGFASEQAWVFYVATSVEKTSARSIWIVGRVVFAMLTP